MHNRIGRQFQRRIDVPVWLERGPLGRAYANKILGIQRSSLIAYYPLWENAGVVAENLEGTAARNGTYLRDVSVMGTATGIGDGNTAPVFDGAADGVNIFSPSLDAAWDQSESTVGGWFQPANVGIWSDATIRKLFRLFVDANNTLKAERGAVNDNLDIKCELGGVNEFMAWLAGPSTAWQHFMVTVSQANDRCIVYGNGLPIQTNVGLGVWAGPLDALATMLGASTSAPLQSWLGQLAHWPIWTTELSAPEVLVAATV